MTFHHRLTELTRAARAIRAPSDIVLVGRMVGYARRSTGLAGSSLAAMDRGARPTRRSSDPEHAAAAERLLPLALALVKRRDCLPRGLTAYHFLNSYGRPVDLVFGIRGGSEPSAHCWLEHAGEPYLEPGRPRDDYAVTHVIAAD